MDSFEYEDIKNRIMENLKNPTSKLEGSFSMDNIQAVAQELAMMYAMEVATIPGDSTQQFRIKCITQFMVIRRLN